MKAPAAFVIAFLACAAQCAEEPSKGAGFGWFTNFTAETFRRQPAARKQIDPDHLDRALLDAAIFHETNRRRIEHNLPPLGFDPKARQAAQMQSEAMAKHRFVSHENAFDPKRKSLPDRARLIGMRPRFLAENVASTFGRAYDGGTEFYVRTESGRKIYSVRPGGPQIPMRTYTEAATALLNQWMESPGHRQNILHQSAAYLGCACEPAPAEREMEKFYCTQVFFTPIEVVRSRERIVD